MSRPRRTEANHVSVGWAVKIVDVGAGRMRWDVEFFSEFGDKEEGNGVGNAEGAVREDNMPAMISMPMSFMPPMM